MPLGVIDEHTNEKMDGGWIYHQSPSRLKPFVVFMDIGRLFKSMLMRLENNIFIL